MQLLTSTCIIFVIYALAFTVALPTANSKLPYKLGTNSFFLGTVEGKSYMVDSTPRNWTDANAFCKESGMRLATITTAEQRNFLQSKHDEDKFIYLHWIGGRDVQTLHQFVFDDNQSPVPDSVIDLRFIDAEIQSCLAYDSILNDPHYHLRLCSSQSKVLCEL